MQEADLWSLYRLMYKSRLFEEAVMKLWHDGKIYGEMHLAIGGRNSAIEPALDIFRSGGAVTLVHRWDGFDDSVKYWILPDIENRIALGEIKAHFHIQ